MVKIVVKKEGSTQTCSRCETELICRLKEYGGNFAPTLQWQNYDGKAHYKTSDGKNYACNIPEDAETEQTRIQSEGTNLPETGFTPSATTPGDIPPSVNLSIINTLDEIKLVLQRMNEMTEAIFRYTVDEQLKKKDI